MLKVCATKNEETVSYRKATGNFNFGHFDNTSVYSHVNCDINMKLCVKCCGGENGEPLVHVTCARHVWVRHMDGASAAPRIGGCED